MSDVINPPQDELAKTEPSPPPEASPELQRLVWDTAEDISYYVEALPDTLAVVACIDGAVRTLCARRPTMTRLQALEAIALMVTELQEWQGAV